MASDPKELDLTIYQGRTFQHVVRWETSPIVYKAITGITRAAPVVITAPGHGLATGWYAAITDVVGMTEINAASNTPKTSDFRQVTVVGDDTVSINTLDSAGFTAYVSGGYLRYNTPKDLTSAIARMRIKDRVGGTTLQILASATNEIVLNNVDHTITMQLTPAVTAAFSFKKGVYDLELETADGAVAVLLTGAVTVIPEITAEA